MMRGMTYFKCPHCGKVFKGPDMEDRATVHTAPLHCPECGTLSPKYEGIGGLLANLFKKE